MACPLSYSVSAKE